MKQTYIRRHQRAERGGTCVQETEEGKPRTSAPASINYALHMLFYVALTLHTAFLHISLFDVSHTHTDVGGAAGKPSSLFSLSLSLCECVCVFPPLFIFFSLSFPSFVILHHSFPFSHSVIHTPPYTVPLSSSFERSFLAQGARSLSRSPNARGTALARSLSLSQNPARTELLKIQQEQNCSKSSKNRIRVRGGDGDVDEAVDECWLIHSQQQFMLLAETRDSVETGWK